MVTLSTFCRSCSNRLQNPQFGSSKIAILRLPLPRTIAKESLTGSLSNATASSLRCFSSVMLRWLFVSMIVPCTKYRP